MPRKYGEIDLRSDTVTRPTSGMREATPRRRSAMIWNAEDPTVNRLEDRMAELLGMEAAVFACSGTQSNQMGVRAHCIPGDELLIDETGHIGIYEGGAPARRRHGAAFAGKTGPPDVPPIWKAMSAPDNQHFCVTRLVCVENTTNRGGFAWPIEQMARVSSGARGQGLKVHLDGPGCSTPPRRRDIPSSNAEHVDSVSICFSKGLGCPMGSVLVGDQTTITKARRIRKLFGGAMRQSGMMAAAAIYARASCRAARGRSRTRPGFCRSDCRDSRHVIDPQDVGTNLVFFDVEEQRGPAAELDHPVAGTPGQNAAGSVRSESAPARISMSIVKTSSKAKAIRTVMGELTGKPKTQKTPAAAGSYGGR
ncbi:MAG: beta-eliminating lyase-related protein [Planctomycetaceae bacterium]